MAPRTHNPAATMAVPSAPEPAPPPSPGHSHGVRGAAINALAVLLVAASSGLQVALYLRDFGATHRTDGFIAAFAVYSLVVVLGQLLRTTAVPLLSGARPALSQAAFGWAVVPLGVGLAALCAALASPLGGLVAHTSGHAGRSVAVTSLRVMAPAMGLQIIGSGLAVKGAVETRIEAVAVAYIASAVAGLIAFFVLKSTTAEAVIAWTMLVSSVVLVIAQIAGIGARAQRPPPLAKIRRAIAGVLRTLPLPASFVIMYPVTLALLPSDQAGAITLFGLAYGACSYLIGFTGQALSMTDSVTLARLDSGAAAQRQALVTRAFRYSMLLAAPGLGVAVVAGAPILKGLLPASSAGSHGLFADDALLLIPWLIMMLALWATLPALLSGPHRVHDRRANAGVLALLGVHVAAALIGRAVAGFDGMILATLVAPAVFDVVAIRVAVPRAAGEFIRTGAMIVAIAGVSFGLPGLANSALTSAGPVLGVVTAIVGGVIYLVVSARVYPDAARMLVRLARRS